MFFSSHSKICPEAIGAGFPIRNEFTVHVKYFRFACFVIFCMRSFFHLIPEMFRTLNIFFDSISCVMSFTLLELASNDIFPNRRNADDKTVWISSPVFRGLHK